MTEPPSPHLSPAYRSALAVSALLNAVMVVVEGVAGLVVGSAALLADAVDFIEDAGMFALALVAIGWSPRARAGAAAIQGAAMALVGFGAIAAIVRRLLVGGAPDARSIGAVALLALAVNLYCAWRLARFTRGDSSMRAAWLSARNDAILNMLTIVAAIAILLTRTAWPDIAAGALIGAINLWAAGEVLLKAVREARAPAPSH
jgi:Co/Zn/Cd efflux system component